MKTICVSVAALCLLLVAPAPGATVRPTPQVHPRDPAPRAGAAQMVQQAFTAISHNDVASAQTELDKALQVEDFDDLPTDLRYRALLIASLIATQANQGKKAHDLIVRATAFDEANEMAWSARLSAALVVDDYGDAGHSVAVFAQRWPGKLDGFNPALMGQLHRQLSQSDNANVDLEMLDSLFDARWQYRGFEPSDLWRDLALLHIEHNELARATKVASRITSGRTALSMLVDKRFDPITSKRPEGFDVDHLIAAEIQAGQERLNAHPDELEPVTDLQQLFLITRQFSRVLAVSEAVVTHAEHGDGAKTYTDFGEKYNWVLDNRSRAFKRQGDPESALRVEGLAARHPEQSGMNVSQLINLGELYAELNKPDQAADAIVELGNASPFGRMQLESVRLAIAVEKKNPAAIASSTSYLKEHRADAIATWQDALLLLGDLDEAAALLIERLQAPAWRNAALVDMQHYADVVETPMEQTLHARWSTVTARADVQAAMQKVGRVKQFRITADLR